MSQRQGNAATYTNPLMSSNNEAMNTDYGADEFRRDLIVGPRPKV